MAIDHTEIDAFNRFIDEREENGSSLESLEDAIREFRACQSKQSSVKSATVVDPRDKRLGPATSEFTRRLRERRKQHLANGGRLLNMDEIDELVAECQGSLSGKD